MHGSRVSCDVRAGRHASPRARIAAWWRAAAVVAGAVCATACAGLLGIDDRSPDPQDAGGDAGSAFDAYRPDSGGAGADAAGDGPSADGSGGDDVAAVEGGIDAGMDTGTGDDAEMVDTGPAPADGATDAPGDGGCPSACPPDKPTCENGQCVVRGPVMVSVNSFYVDSTEVTVADYKKFLAAKGSDTSGQPSECSWNTAYWDSTNSMNPDTWPITNVDWCDAHAFCAWAGKRLCGKIGGGPVTAEADLFMTPPSNEWYLACGGPNGGTHPNSNPMCNSTDGFGDLGPVGSFPGCEGFYPGLFDLEGNAAEWIDGCQVQDGGEVCFLLGGGIFDAKSYCDEVYDAPRNATAVSYGFRCCGG
jgi:hypothetical protein